MGALAPLGHHIGPTVGFALCGDRCAFHAVRLCAGSGDRQADSGGISHVGGLQLWDVFFRGCDVRGIDTFLTHVHDDPMGAFILLRMMLLQVASPFTVAMHPGVLETCLGETCGR